MRPNVLPMTHPVSRPVARPVGGPARLLPALVGLVVLLSACRATSTVSIHVAEDGSGLVEVAVVLDDEAVEAVGGVDHQIRLDDLSDAGWEVDGPSRSDHDGLTTVTASKPFEVPDRLPPILGEIAGPGVFDGMALVRERTFARTTWRLESLVDLSAGLALFSDPDLAITLSGLPLGRTSAELAALAGCETGCDPADSFSMDLVVTMPGEVVGNTDLVDSATARWTIDLGGRTPTVVELSGSVVDRAPRLWLGVAFVSAALFLLVMMFQVARRLLGHHPGPRRDRHAPAPVRRIRRVTEIVEQTPDTRVEPEPRRLELVVLGGVGVVWDGGTDPEGLLVSFVRARRGIADSREVADRYRAASLGQVSSGEFWASVGVEGDPDEIDEEYLAGVRLRPDVMAFLEQMAERELTVACLTNAVLPWTKLLRARFDLDRMIGHWVVSGEIGARKPGQAMFEALRRMSDVTFRNMLLIDSEQSALEAARGMGMSTVLMRGTALIPEGFAHPTIDGFAGLFRQTGG